MISCDVQRCVGCRMCEVACSASHFGAVSPALSRIRVAKLEEIGIDLAVACLGCAERPCLECSVDALAVGARGEILLDRETCIACEECVGRCPVGAIGCDEGLPLFCDLCGGTPECVDVCPSRALSDERGLEPSLEVFLEAEGTPAQKRAHYATVRSRPVRERWRGGWRLEP